MASTNVIALLTLIAFSLWIGRLVVRSPSVTCATRQGLVSEAVMTQSRSHRSRNNDSGVSEASVARGTGVLLHWKHTVRASQPSPRWKGLLRLSRRTPLYRNRVEMRGRAAGLLSIPRCYRAALGWASSPRLCLPRRHHHPSLRRWMLSEPVANVEALLKPR